MSRAIIVGLFAVLTIGLMGANAGAVPIPVPPIVQPTPTPTPLPHASQKPTPPAGHMVAPLQLAPEAPTNLHAAASVQECEQHVSRHDCEHGPQMNALPLSDCSWTLNNGKVTYPTDPSCAVLVWDVPAFDLKGLSWPTRTLGFSVYWQSGGNWKPIYSSQEYGAVFGWPAPGHQCFAVTAVWRYSWHNTLSESQRSNVWCTNAPQTPPPTGRPR
jgi:hypothetical protein